MTDIVERLQAIWVEVGNVLDAVRDAKDDNERLRLEIDTLGEIVTEKDAEIKRLREAVRAEREACVAKINKALEDMPAPANSEVAAYVVGLRTAAAAIRARGDNPSPVADKPLTGPDQITD